MSLDEIRKKVIFHNSVDVGLPHVLKKKYLGKTLKIIKNSLNICCLLT